MSSSNALVADAAPESLVSKNPVAECERPLVGTILRLGSDALDLAVLNRVTAADFSDEACSELFELLRRTRLAGRSILLATLTDEMAAQGLTETAGVALQAAAALALSDVPTLSYTLVTWAEYHGAMRTLSRGHRDFTVTMDTSGHPRELLKVIERVQWDLRKHAQRWKDLLCE